MSDIFDILEIPEIFYHNVIIAVTSPLIMQVTGLMYQIWVRKCCGAGNFFPLMGAYSSVGAYFNNILEALNIVILVHITICKHFLLKR